MDRGGGGGGGGGGLELKIANSKNILLFNQ